MSAREGAEKSQDHRSFHEGQRVRWVHETDLNVTGVIVAVDPYMGYADVRWSDIGFGHGESLEDLEVVEDRP